MAFDQQEHDRRRAWERKRSNAWQDIAIFLFGTFMTGGLIGLLLFLLLPLFGVLGWDDVPPDHWFVDALAIGCIAALIIYLVLRLREIEVQNERLRRELHELRSNPSA